MRLSQEAFMKQGPQLSKLTITLIVLVATIFFFAGFYTNSLTAPETRLETAAENYPTGIAGVPAQWFMMKSLVGWERMMFIFGYADDREVCEHLVEIGRKESPDREFRCDDAN